MKRRVTTVIVLTLGSLLAGGASIGWAQLPAPDSVANGPKAAEVKSSVPSPVGSTTPEKQAKSPVEPASSKPTVQEVSPPLYYLRDKSGNLVPVPGFRLEDFEQMVKRQYGEAAIDQAPRYALQSFQASGKALADWVELQVRLNLVTREDGWIRVPLRLDQAVLRSGVQYQGSGQHFVQFDSGGDGYVFWVRGGTEREHQLTLDLMVPVARFGTTTRMKLVVPRAATSELKLVVPIADAVAKVTEGPILLPSTPEGKTATVLNLAGLGGEFELTWGKDADRPSETLPVLDVTATVQWKVGSRNLDGEVRMQARSLAAPFDSFQVRLPQGVELVPGKTNLYTLATVKPAQPAAEERALVEVRLPKKTVGPVEVQLPVRLALETAGPAAWVEVASFEVLGAARQAGHVAIRADNQWRVLVGPLRGARQVDELPKALRTDDVAAGFEYSTQPCALPIRVVRRAPRISVEPEYLVLVDADQMRLEARLKYMIRAAEVATLEIDLPGWELDEVGPENVVATDLIVDSAAMRSIPLAQRSIGPVELSLRAHRPIPPDSRRISVELPRPRADSQASPVVVVLPADNVELIPDPKGTVGLVRQQVAPPMKLPQRQQDPFVYRAEPSKATLVAQLRVHPQRVTVAVSTEITVDEQRAEVRQKMTYQVAHQAIDRLSFETPRSLASVEPLSVLFEGKTLRLVDMPDPSDQFDTSGPARKQVILPESRIVSCEVTIGYAIALPKLVPRSSVVASIPLVMPAEGELSGNRLWIAAPEGIRVQARGGPWNEAAAPVSELRRGLHLTAAQRVQEIEAAVYLEDQSSAGSTVVHRAWIQTWLTHSLRQDRAVFWLTTSQKSLDLALPVGVSPSDIELWLDGQPITGQPTPELRLIVALPPGSGQREHRLEAAYRIAGPRPGWGRMSLELPRLAREVWVQRFYWQLVLPNREHLLFAPADLSEEDRWVWQGPLCVREPLWEQAQLETWTGARRLAEPPAETNRYLLSGLGSLNRCEVWTIDRTMLVFGSSLAVLILGLTLLYLPAARHPAGLLVLALMAAAGAVVYPSPTLLLAQASLLGGMLALAAAWLHRVLTKRRLAAVRETQSSILDRGSSLSSRRAVALAGSPPPDPPPEQAQVSTTEFRV
jgi:hypothetical protein